MIADHFHCHRTLLLAVALIGPLLVLTLLFASSFTWSVFFIAIFHLFYHRILLARLLGAFVCTAIYPLVDAAVLSSLGANRAKYGRERLWVLHIIFYLGYYFVIFS